MKKALVSAVVVEEADFRVRVILAKADRNVI